MKSLFVQILVAFALVGLVVPTCAWAATSGPASLDPATGKLKCAQAPTTTLSLPSGSKTLTPCSTSTIASTDILSGGTMGYLLEWASANSLQLSTLYESGSSMMRRRAGDNIFLLKTFSTTTSASPYLWFLHSHNGTIDTLTQTVDTEYLGWIAFQGVSTYSLSANGAAIRAQQVGSAGTYVPTKLVFSTYSASAQNVNQLVLNPDGSASFAAALTIGGAVAASNITATPTPYAVPKARSDGTLDPGWYSITTTSTSTATGTGYDNYVARFLGGAIVQADIWSSGSQVCVGCTDPATGVALDVQGNIKSRGNIQAGTNATIYESTGDMSLLGYVDASNITPSGDTPGHASADLELPAGGACAAGTVLAYLATGAPTCVTNVSGSGTKDHLPKWTNTVTGTASSSSTSTTLGTSIFRDNGTTGDVDGNFNAYGSLYASGDIQAGGNIYASNITGTPGATKIPVSNGSGNLNDWVTHASGDLPATATGRLLGTDYTYTNASFTSAYGYTWSTIVSLTTAHTDAATILIDGGASVSLNVATYCTIRLTVDSTDLDPVANTTVASGRIHLALFGTHTVTPGSTHTVYLKIQPNEGGRCDVAAYTGNLRVQEFN